MSQHSSHFVSGSPQRYKCAAVAGSPWPCERLRRARGTGVGRLRTRRLARAGLPQRTEGPAARARPVRPLRAKRTWTGAGKPASALHQNQRGQCQHWQGSLAPSRASAGARPAAGFREVDADLPAFADDWQPRGGVTCNVTCYATDPGRQLVAVETLVPRRARCQWAKAGAQLRSV